MTGGWVAILDADRRWFLAVNGVDHPVWDGLFGWGTWLGDGLVLTFILLTLTRLGDRKRFPKNFLIVGLAMALSGIVNGMVKNIADRPRPLSDAVLAAAAEPFETRDGFAGLTVRIYPTSGERIDGRASWIKVLGHDYRRRSFPSGHTAAAFAFAAGMVYISRRRGRHLWWLYAVFVGVSRVACGVHFPLDVLGGAFVGLATTWCVLRPFEIFHGLGSRPRPWPRRAAVGAPLRVLVVAGEASADVYGARILSRLRERFPRLDAVGVGGERLEREGLRLVADAHELSIVGFTAVVASLRTIVRVYRRLIDILYDEPPDAVVCIDLPDFNLMLATQARAQGIPVVFVISPQIWAWRQGRVAKIADRISRMVVAFPFEKRFYEEAGVPVSYHGHPLLEGMERRFPDRRAAREHFGLDPDRKTLVVAPGSRSSELRHLLGDMLGAARIVLDEFPDWQVAVPLAPRVSEELVRSVADSHGVPVVTTKGDNPDLFACADFGLICSGTATLEAALAGLPMLIVYRGNRLNIFIARRMVQIDRIGLPNIILGGDKVVFPELIQDDARSAPLALAALRILRTPGEYERLRAACEQVRAKLDGGAVSAAIADDILDVLTHGESA